MTRTPNHNVRGWVYGKPETRLLGKYRWSRNADLLRESDSVVDCACLSQRTAELVCQVLSITICVGYLAVGAI